MSDYITLIQTIDRRPIPLWATLCLMLACFLGCDLKPTPEFRLNRVEILKQERLTLPSGESFDADYQRQLQVGLSALFGTPDTPSLPLLDYFDRRQRDRTETGLAPIFLLPSLQLAAGPVKSDEDGKPSGLYREHCANCHGLTGDGAGSTAGLLNPYPRDFRLGKFKFKSTPLRQAPTHQDLMQVMVNGIPGTAMPSFANLSAEELGVLIDYVRYLSLRGQVERLLISEIVQLDDQPLIRLENSLMDTDWRSWTDEQGLDIADQTIDLIGVDTLQNLIDRWFVAEQRITTVPAAPYDLMPETLLSSTASTDWIERGKVLFYGDANCSQCHGQDATGDGLTNNYDDWTNEWLKYTASDLTTKDKYREFLAVGALPPRPILARNLNLAVLRGGNQPEVLYRRIANGIEGTPMPSAPTLSSDDIWSLVAYLKSMGRK